MGHPTYERDASDLHTTNVSDTGWNPPYLPRALLHAPVGTKDYYRTTFENKVKAGTANRVSLRDPATFDDELKLLLGHIEERLQLGLQEAWCSEDGYGDEAAEAAQIQAIYAGEGTREDKEKKAQELRLDSQDYMFSPEERWASAFSEMISFLPYSGVGVAYYGGDQKTMFQKFGAGAYPVIVACQDLCTLCVLSRGYSYSPDLEIGGFGGCSCTSGSVDYPAFDTKLKMDGGVGEDLTPEAQKARDDGESPPPLNYMQTANLVKLRNKQDEILPPGSILVFNKDQKTHDQEGDAHIISVLRVSGSRIQFLETGAYDALHTFSDSVPFSPLVGVGVLGHPKLDLQDAAVKMLTMRPLGYARLVVLDTSAPGDPIPRFISKLFHLRYHVSSYVWAMRGLPIENLRVVVHVYMPLGKASTDPLLADDSLSKPPSELIRGGTLLHVAAIRGDAPNLTSVPPDDGKANVARLRQDNQTSASVLKDENKKAQLQGCWYENLNPASKNGVLDPPPADMGFNLPLYVSPTTPPRTLALELWCRTVTNAGKRYICKPPEKLIPFDKLMADDPGSTGVGHFDP